MPETWAAAASGARIIIPAKRPDFSMCSPLSALTIAIQRERGFHGKMPPACCNAKGSMPAQQGVRTLELRHARFGIDGRRIPCSAEIAQVLVARQPDRQIFRLVGIGGGNAPVFLVAQIQIGI